MEEMLRQGAKELGITLSDTQISQLVRYARLLQEWSQKMNLTAIKDDEGIVTKHFLDSLSAIKTGYVSGRVIDVGTGAGFPGLVLKIAMPEIKLTLLDSLNKRLTFLKAVCDDLGMDDVEFIHARAEDFAMKPGYRAGFDTVVSRAVAKMETLAEWCIPYLREGGYFLALKGPAADEEIVGAKRAITIMGGDAPKTVEVQIPYTDLNHRIICIKKVRQTPMRFPRKKAIAAKLSVEQCYKKRK